MLSAPRKPHLARTGSPFIAPCLFVVENHAEQPGTHFRAARFKVLAHGGDRQAPGDYAVRRVNSVAFRCG
jgi:hypothetical protein